MIGVLLAIALWLMLLRYRYERRCYSCNGPTKWRWDYWGRFCLWCGARQ